MILNKYVKTVLVFGVLLGWLYYEYGVEKINTLYLGEAISVPIIWVLGSMIMLILVMRNKKKLTHFTFLVDFVLVVGSTLYLLILSPVSFLILAWVIPILVLVVGLVRLFVLNKKAF